MTSLLTIAAVTYLLGSIPFGYLLVRVVRGEDVRLSGSGNIGATNVSRKSPALGILTLALDAAKGAASVALAGHLSDTDPRTHYMSLSLAAFCAVVGHVAPVWLKFRGGKGVATGLGSFVMIAPKSVFVAAVVFFLIVAVFRYVSLGSIIGVAIFPILAWVLHEYGETPVALALMAAASLLIIWKHHENIQRLLAGTENRFGSKNGPPTATQEKQ
ncbi:MAG TPA: glycerol-3-phosphate 1-O-acyltransferase PlsY [Candidatus Sulfotelmatobacter sp.]|nr:glycerol-3-phosphate 1-O-acyltransferase PlsY [Candidatus Sulfotelmatobacter sp.]